MKFFEGGLGYKDLVTMPITKLLAWQKHAVHLAKIMRDEQEKLSKSGR